MSQRILERPKIGKNASYAVYQQAENAIRQVERFEKTLVPDEHTDKRNAPSTSADNCLNGSRTSLPQP